MPAPSRHQLILASQFTGVVATELTDGNVGQGARIAGQATEYNYLAHWQEAQKDDEVAACKNKGCEIGIKAKWAMVDAQQDMGLIVGAAGGLALSAKEAADGIYELVTNSSEVIEGMRQLATSPEFRQQFGENYLNDLQVRTERLAEVYETVGWEGSVTAGVEGGRFAAELAGVLAVVKGGAQLVARLPSSAGKLIKATRSGQGADYVDILTPEAKQHILYGDRPGNGGHMWPGQEDKVTFPQKWTSDKIIHEVGDIVTSPNTQWYAQTGTGGRYTSKGDPAKWVAYETRDGVRIRVVYQPVNGKVITSFPDESPMPSYKKVE